MWYKAQKKWLKCRDLKCEELECGGDFCKTIFVLTARHLKCAGGSICAMLSDVMNARACFQGRQEN
jgi:hypothetical protein